MDDFDDDYRSLPDRIRGLWLDGIDERSYALFRIAFAFVALANLVNLWFYRETLFSSGGMISADAVAEIGWQSKLSVFAIVDSSWGSRDGVCNCSDCDGLPWARSISALGGFGGFRVALVVRESDPAGLHGLGSCFAGVFVSSDGITVGLVLVLAKDQPGGAGADVWDRLDARAVAGDLLAGGDDEVG